MQNTVYHDPSNVSNHAKQHASFARTYTVVTYLKHKLVLLQAAQHLQQLSQRYCAFIS